MRTRVLVCLWSIWAAAMPVAAADLSECVKLAVKPSGEASITNGCAGRLNIMYCVDNANSAKACSSTPISITTLSPMGTDVLPAYASEGRGEIYWAVCMYPEAPVGWTPGRSNPYTCKKTCVMC